MILFQILAASFALAVGKWNIPEHDSYKKGQGNKHSNGRVEDTLSALADSLAETLGKWSKPEQDPHEEGHGNKHSNGRVEDHLPAPNVEGTRSCDSAYNVSESATEAERCRDSKKFFYTDRYKNETFCSNSASFEVDECWWDTSIGSNCLESTECVWLTNTVEQGMCYCSASTRCEACEHQTPAPTYNTDSSQCPENCEVYYLGCVGMYCKCLGGCTSSEEAGCRSPVNAGCYSYFEEGDQGDRKNDEDDTTLDQIVDAYRDAIADKIVSFIDQYGEGRYEIFGDLAYLYRDGHLMRIISARLLNLDDLIRSGIDGNNWFDELIPSESAEDVDYNGNNWFDDLIPSESGEDVDNKWSWFG